MLAGIISDAHSNFIALVEVLRYLKDRGISTILSAGDTIGYNPYPNETVGIIKNEGISSVMGNHDHALITGDISSFNPYAAEAILWTKRVISPSNLRFLKSLKISESLVVDGLHISIFHGSPRSIEEYIFPEDVDPGFLQYTGSEILILGHTHVPYIKRFKEGIIVNPGSVGQPRDGDARASFALLDTETKKIDLLRIEYDIEKVMTDILMNNLPEKLAIRLQFGI